MNPRILGLGTACPPHAIEQSQAAIMAQSRCAQDERQAKLLPELYRRTTVKHRRSVLFNNPQHQPVDATAADAFFNPPEQGHLGPTTANRMAAYARYAPPLAAQACREALADASIDPAAITHLVTVSCTGFVSPGVEHHLIGNLGLSQEVKRTLIGFMGCHGALNGLQVSRAFAKADANARVLLVCVELCSLHFQYGWHPQRIVSNALFADGAAAVVISQSSCKDFWTIRDTASRIIPDSASDMSWEIGDHGFEMTLASTVPARIGEHLKDWLSQWMDKLNMSLDDIQSYAIHPGGPRIVASAAEALGLKPHLVDDSLFILQEYGNMSSATLLFILHRQRERNVPLPRIAMSFGPGLAAEAVLLTRD